MLMSLEEQKVKTERFFTEVLNNHNFSLIEEFFAPEYILHTIPQPVKGVEEYRQFLEAMLFVYPDIHFTLEDFISLGDKNAMRWSATGTHQGDWLGVSPTGKTVTVYGMVFQRLNADTKVVEAWMVEDHLNALIQIGAIKATTPNPSMPTANIN